MQGFLIGQFDRDQGVTIRGRVVHAEAHLFDAGDFDQQITHFSQCPINVLTTDARLDSQDNIVPNHTERATFPYRMAPGATYGTIP